MLHFIILHERVCYSYNQRTEGDTNMINGTILAKRQNNDFYINKWELEIC